MASITEITNGDEILRLPDVMRMIGRSKSSIWRDIKSGRLSPPLRIGVRAVGWPRKVIHQYLAGLPLATATLSEGHGE